MPAKSIREWLLGLGFFREDSESETMSKRSIVSWLREFAVIVVGVFVALAAESWWSAREERRVEREIREDIAAEFEANIRILQADLATNKVSRPQLAVLEGLTIEELMTFTDAQMTDSLRSVEWAGFDPEMGSAQAMVQSGNVVIVSDREMRLALARWSGLLELNNRFTLMATQYEQREVRPVFVRAAADGVWSESERREMQLHRGELLGFFDNTVENQQDLLAAAEAIRSLQLTND